MKKLQHLILFAFILIITSCGEDDPCKDFICQNQGICIDGKCDCPDGFEGELCQEKSKSLLKAIFLHGVMEEFFEYNEDRSLSKKTEYLSSEHIVETTYAYATDSIIANGVNSINNGTFALKYHKITSDQIKFEIFSDGISAEFYYVYSSFDQNCGHGKYFAYSSNDILQSERTLDYTDENCSSNQFSINSMGDSIGVIIETQNDDKNYYNESTRINYLKSPNRGNPIRFIVKDENNEILNSSSYTSTYTYNEDDYPTVEVRDYLNGKLEIRSFLYY